MQLKKYIKSIEGKKSGLILEVPKITDYVAGLETAIEYEETNPTGNWSSNYPTNESQKNNVADFLDCTSESHTNIRETRMNYKLKNNLYPDYVVKFLNDKGFIDTKGNINFSQRLLAKMVKTDINRGAKFTDVAEIVRTCGLVPDSVWPTNPNITWKEYYAEPPQKIIDQAKEILEVFNFLYEWVDNNFALIDDPLGADTLKAMKQAPLQVALGLPAFHAVEMGNLEIDNGIENVEIYDSYDPFIKHGNNGLLIHYSLKLVDMIKEPEIKIEAPIFTFTKNLKYGSNNQDVKMLQQALKYKGYYKLVLDTSFGVKTKEAVQKYQIDNGLKGDGIVGPKTNAILNKEFSTTKKKALE